MGTVERFESVDDAALVARLDELVSHGREVDADVVAHIGEVDARRLYLGRGCSSMFAYCTERLHMSEHAAYLRIQVARTSRRFPVLLDMLADGQLHLSGIAVLGKHLTEDNVDRVLPRAAHRSKRDIERLVAELAPKPDAPSVLRKLPTRPVPAATLPAVAMLTPSPSTQPPETRLGPDRVAPRRPAPLALAPLAPARFKVQFTASEVLRDKLARLRALTRRQVPDGDLAAVVELAVDAYLAKLEARRFGTTDKPRASARAVHGAPRSRHIPAAIRRAVVARDGNQCTFESDDGHRCSATDDLRCPAHNRYRAVQDFGPRGRGARETRRPYSASRESGPPLL